MITTDQRVARSARSRAPSSAVALSSHRLRLVLEYLRSHDDLAEPASDTGHPQNADLSVDLEAGS
jgi:hypothetical protein